MRDPRSLPAEVLSQLQQTVIACGYVTETNLEAMGQDGDDWSLAISAQEQALALLGLHARAWRKWLESEEGQP